MTDIITVWPRDVYYPYFAWRINKDRDLFDRVIVVMSEGNPRFDFTRDIGIKRSTVLTPDLLKLTEGGRDWRHMATLTGLAKSNAKSVLFLEQDFFVKDGFFQTLLEKGKEYQTVGFVEGNRLHPACLLTQKETLNKTDKDFAAYPPIGDHFSRFTKQLMNIGFWTTLGEAGLADWYHLSGLTHNYRLESNFHRADDFHTYNDLCLKLEMPQAWRDFLVNRKCFNYVFNGKIAEYFDEKLN